MRLFFGIFYLGFEVCLHALKWLALISILILFLSTQTLGLKSIFHILALSSPYEFQGVSGNLLAGKLTTLRRNTEEGLCIDNLRWDLDLNASVKEKKLIIKQIAIQDIKFDIPASQERNPVAMQPIALKALDYLSLKSLKIDKISLKTYSKAFDLENFNFKNSIDTAKPSLSFNLPKQYGRVLFKQINFAFNPENYSLELNLPSIIGRFDQAPIQGTANLLISQKKLVTAELHITAGEHQLHFSHLEDFKLNLTSPLIELVAKGNRSEHQIYLKTVYEDLEVISKLTGGYRQQQYHAKIDQLKLSSLAKNNPWTFKNSTPLLADFKEKNLILTGQELSLIGFDKIIKLKSLDLVLNFIQKSLDLKLLSSEEGSLKLAAHLEKPEFNTLALKHRPLKGSLVIQMPSLPMLNGSATANLSLGGNLDHPIFRGDLLFKDTLIPFPQLATQLKFKELHFLANGTNALKILGQGKMGKGLLDLTGDLSFKQQKPELMLKLNGQQLLLSNTPEYYLIGSPKLNLAFKDEQFHLNGDVFIDEAKIEPRDNQELKTSSGDVHIHRHNEHASQSTAAKDWGTVDGLIQLHLGNKTNYKGYGLSTKVTGSLGIEHAQGQIPIANGKLHLINGKYRSFGQNFEIAKGVLHFSKTPVNDPVIDIQAIRKIKTNLSASGEQQFITAGLSLNGPIKQPKLSLFSNPHKDEGDILSYLVLGVPKDHSDAVSSETLIQAANQLAEYMGFKQENGPFWLGKMLALDDMGLGKRNTQFATSNDKSRNAPFDNTEFYLGKQLSKRLYLQYSIGIIDSLNTVRLRYLLSRYFTLEVTSSDQGKGNAGELLFTVDR